jgi:hypothetical protein
VSASTTPVTINQHIAHLRIPDSPQLASPALKGFPLATRAALWPSFRFALDIRQFQHDNLLAACSPGGAASGRVNCSHGGEVCVNLSTVKSFAMGDAVPLKITVTSSKDISDLSITIDTGTEITMDGTQTWENDLSNENNQLLAQQCIFDHQIRSVSHEVRPDPRNQGQWSGFGPIFNFLMKPKKVRGPE